jgi:uncharacterized protein with GYD domain
MSISFSLPTRVSALSTETIERATAATAETEKMGAKVTEAFWTMGAYDVVLLLDAPDDETASAF